MFRAPAHVTPSTADLWSRERLEWIQTLHPAYFALVMATGIVAIAAYLQGMLFVAKALTLLNTAAFTVLLILTFARIVLFPAAFFRDFSDFDRGPGFFTTVAALTVLGSEWLLIYKSATFGLLLWICAAPLWACFTYSIFGGFTIKEKKPALADGINGGWLIAVVATQGVSHLTSLLSSGFPNYRREMLFFSLSMWLCGGMLYIWLISLIFYRYTFFRFLPSDLRPPYWINMGAMAISTLAGTTLLLNGSTVDFISELRPFIKGFTVLFWATATWWIPMLLILGYWRHVIKKFRLAYHPLYWGAVFPLGMYTVCTRRLSEVMDLNFLLWIPHVFIWIALAAWGLAFIGLLHSVATSTRSPGAMTQSNTR